MQPVDFQVLCGWWPTCFVNPKPAKLLGCEHFLLCFGQWDLQHTYILFWYAGAGQVRYFMLSQSQVLHSSQQMCYNSTMETPQNTSSKIIIDEFFLWIGDLKVHRGRELWDIANSSEAWLGLVEGLCSSGDLTAAEEQLYLCTKEPHVYILCL